MSKTDRPQTYSDLLHQHDDTVADLSRQVARFHEERVSFRIYHGSTNSTRSSVRTHATTLDTSSLNHILRVDPHQKTCLVEPNVPMDALVAATLNQGLVPPVVPEFPGITVGGGFAGTAGESSSFKYGFFDRAMNWIEMILADGEVVLASDTERRDLFYGAAGTFGTLGVATLFEMRLIPAKEFVELTYFPVRGITHAQEVMDKVARDETTDFLDGIMFAPDRGVIMAGKMADGREERSNLPVVTFTKAWDQWFYLHAEERIADDGERRESFQSSVPSSLPPRRDLIPLPDYLFRYDRGAFWTGKYAFWYFCTPFNRCMRWLLDRLMHTRTMYHALHRSSLTQRYIIQDLAVPPEHMPEFSKWLDAELGGVYPRWLCPLRQDKFVLSMHPHLPATSRQEQGEGLLNIGVWGPLPNGQDQVIVNRRIEAKLHALHGMKWLYAQAFYTEDEFWRIYDKPWYDALREKYKAKGLPDVYEKVRTRLDPKRDLTKGVWSIWPLAGLYGIASVLKGGDYLRKG